MGGFNHTARIPPIRDVILIVGDTIVWMRNLALPSAAFLALSGCIQIVQRMDEEDIERLRVRIVHELGREFTVDVVEDLFVVASNADEKRTGRALRILREYKLALEKTYFDRSPSRPVRVFLFGDRESYSRYVQRAYADPPKTPFGFYMPSERKIVVNISTGPGTLAHELVHPLMEADFPRAPSWFNEGFASLFEESDYSPNGTIRGRVNWRLHTLQRALRRPDPPALRDVARLDRDDYYGGNSGIHYAMSRYLCLYLQERGVLVQYYRSFRDTYSRDRTGMRQVEELLGRPLAEVEAEFRDWVLTLREE
jgi:hypothetical protein